MTWGEFQIKVREFLSVHNRRQGIQTLIDNWILSGVIDLQRYIDYFKQGHLNVLTPSNLSTNGFAQRGPLPDGQVTSFRILNLADDGTVSLASRGPLGQISWDQVHLAVLGSVPQGTSGVFVDRRAKLFYLVPALQSGQLLEICWNGEKTSFASSDVVIFDHECAQAVGEYVLARISRLVDKDMAAAQSYSESYKLLRRSMYTEFHRRTFILDTDPTDMSLYSSVMYDPTVTGIGNSTWEQLSDQTWSDVADKTWETVT